ncbi:phage major capsid protein [Leuconostoc mesenteroides]|uniref:phage major capsid protein n=1 Tax=Leuconostoc mesenteroides TaxID=1245 RepID=UPI0010671103|nr:phage major capsid protein [Leuconostoc mesenteroides]MBZ1522413.1 phage major capsid protein [Leuconostoc mesenteroides]TDV88508.1 HK97 family phage major capsid protein [Leuconostoc mesenteroides]
MAVNINDLNEKWVNLGQKVSDLQNQAQLMVDDDAASAEDVADIQTKITNAIAKRDLAHENLVQAQAENVVDEIVEPTPELTPKENDLKKKFVDNFKGMIQGVPTVINQINSSTDSGGNAIGLTIPQDIQTAIHTLVRQYDALEQYVNVESVSTLSGSRVYEKWSDVTPLANLDADDAAIGDNDDPKLAIVKYLIKRYAGISTVTNTLLNDTAENILAWLSSWIAKKVVVTRNKAIIAVMNAAPKKPTIAKFDDVKDMVSTAVDPAVATTSFFLTNVSGLAVLNKVKDAMGNYLLQPDPTQSDVKVIDGKQVKVVADRWLPDVLGSHPLYFGDLKQAVTLFDRQQMSLLSTNVGAGAFEKDLTKIRVIDRFDVVATDTEAFVAGSFKAIADQTANFTAGK